MHSTKQIDRMLDLHDVAVVGVSRDDRQIANAILRKLRDGGRTVHAVNSRADGAPLAGAPSFRTIAELPTGVEGVFVVVPQSEVAGVVRDALAASITNIWIHRGIGGPRAPRDAVEAARRRGASVVADECPLMFVEPVRGIHRIHRHLHREVVA